MRSVLAILVLTLLPTSAAVGPPVATACDAESFLTGTHEACDEAADPFRAGDWALCTSINFWAQGDEELDCGVALDVETSWWTVYVTPELYWETNGCDGWQRDASDCDGDGDVEPADHAPTRGWTLADLLP